MVGTYCRGGRHQARARHGHEQQSIDGGAADVLCWMFEGRSRQVSMIGNTD